MSDIVKQRNKNDFIKPKKEDLPKNKDDLN